MIAALLFTTFVLVCIAVIMSVVITVAMCRAVLRSMMESGADESAAAEPETKRTSYLDGPHGYVTDENGTNLPIYLNRCLVSCIFDAGFAASRSRGTFR